VTALAKFTAKAFSRALAELATVPSQIAPAVAKRINREIQKNFDAGVDPYGHAWAPLRPRTLAKGRHPPPLTDTRKGRRSVRAFATQAAGVAITVGVGYMGIHQAGDPPRMVARKFLPNRVLPASWRAIWQQELTKLTRKRLSRG
jgi:phage gpG-like protein